jgi:hypothetical protein
MTRYIAIVNSKVTSLDSPARLAQVACLRHKIANPGFKKRLADLLFCKKPQSTSFARNLQLRLHSGVTA